MKGSSSRTAKKGMSLEVTYAFNNGKEGLIIRAGNDGSPYLEFEMPDEKTSFRVQNAPTTKKADVERSGEVRIHLSINKSAKRTLIFRDGAAHEEGSKEVFISKQLKPFMARFASLGLVKGPDNPVPYGWFSCMSNSIGTFTGLGAAGGGIVGGVAGATTGSVIGATFGSSFGLSYCTLGAVMGVETS